MSNTPAPAREEQQDEVRAIELSTLEADRELSKEMDLPTWYLAKEAEDDALVAAIKVQYERLIARVNARRNARRWKWGNAFRQQVEADLKAQGGKLKSKDYGTGRAGTRKVPGKLIFKDAEALIQWASENLPDAIKLEARKTPVVEFIKSTGEVPPGVEYQPERESFFPPVTTEHLPMGEHPSLENGNAD